MFHLLRSSYSTSPSSNTTKSSNIQPSTTGSMLRLAFENVWSSVPKKHSELKKELGQIIENMKRLENVSSTLSCNDSLEHDVLKNINDYFRPLEYACQNCKQHSNLIRQTLSCIQKLMELGLLTCTSVVNSNNDSKCKFHHLSDVRLLQAIASCFELRQDENIHLQTLKTILTAVTCCNLSGKSLMLGIKTCLNIMFVSKDENNPKSVLKQILNIVFKRLSEDSLIHSDSESVVSNYTSSASHCIEEFVDIIIEEAANEIIEKQNLNQEEETNVEPLLSATCNMTPTVTKNTTPTALDQNDSTKLDDWNIPNEYSQIQNDVMFILHSLCKMSMKTLSNNAKLEEKTRSIYLELLLDVFENSGQLLTHSAHVSLFDNVKPNLFTSLLMNSLSSSYTIFSLVLKVFHQVLITFGYSLKHEIHLFFANLTRMMNSSGVTHSQKISIIKFLTHLFATHNSDFIHCLFLNFDCQVGMLNIVERLVASLTNVTQMQITSVENTSAVTLTQTIYMKTIAFKALNQILTCLQTCVKNMSLTLMQQQRKQLHDKLEQQKRDKSTIHEGISRFNENPKRGIKYFIQIEQLPDPSLNKDVFETALARLLHTTQGFSKHAIGEYFASPDHVGALIKFIELQSFSGMLFEKALRKCLDLFMLPKESQEIHRVLSAFSDKYVHDNPQIIDEMFHTPDACYVFTISVVMLNSELHNAAVKNIHNTTLESFIQRNSLTDAASIDHKIQERVFNDLKAHEFTLTEDDMSVFDSLKDDISVGNGNIEKVMRGILKSKCCSMEEDTLIQIESSSFTQICVSQALFNCIWKYFHQSFISLFETNLKTHHLVLKSLKAAIQLSIDLEAPIPRNEYLKTLCTFTSLLNRKDSFDMSEKNLVALKLILDILETNVNFILESWSGVMEVFYQVDRILSSSINNDIFIQISGIDNMAILFTQHVDQATIDRIFSNNNEKMDELSIEHYVKALCSLQCKGHANETQRHIFCLNKIIETCYLNMFRMDKLWCRIWNVISNFFIGVATHQDTTLAMYAVDTLRQLILKLIEIGSLSDFQQEMLRPYTVIVQQSSSVEIQVMAIECIVTLALTKTSFITTGCKSWIHIFSVAATSKQMEIVQASFDRLLCFFDKHESRCKYLLWILKNSCFVDLVFCLKAFGQNNISVTDTCLKAISLIQDCANTLATMEMAGEDVTNWIPILACLSSLVSADYREDIRSAALMSLQSLLHDKAIIGRFSVEAWKLVLNGALLPIFDHLSSGSEGVLDNGWIDCTSRNAFKVLVSVLDQNFSSDFSIDLFSSILRLIRQCYTSNSVEHSSNSKIFEVGTENIQILLATCGGKFQDRHWQQMQHLLAEIVSKQNGQNTNLVESLIHITKGIDRILSFLFENQSYEYIPLFVTILEGLEYTTTSNNKINVETEVWLTLLRIFSQILSLYQDNAESEIVGFGVHRFIQTVKQVLTFYLERDQGNDKMDI
ncbi:hypothetical protein C9374_010653 [Naegleria lovaniensis]|uniref:SEC7 domain-containing protein n=1 Tax=Naegleria lovaniensis TaxID=51637 RepID=A0AA88GG22_NAELO|nr:uncharacterized protein C9374_010653 [Naegleria lovaniensis]KAG2374634.1 hypothetical protein C9374_010653 [Naegleria lovaniensis]